MAMHRFFLLSPDSVTHLNDDFRRSLSDQDPGVMEASLLLFHDLIKVIYTVHVHSLYIHHHDSYFFMYKQYKFMETPCV